MLGDQPPPVSNIGVIGWLRANLFSTPMSGVLTIVSLVVIYYALSAILPWVFGGIWNATSLAECRMVIAETLGDSEHASRACWGVVQERFWHLMYGFYPSELYWRPNLALILLFVALAPILFNGLPKAMLIVSVAALFICPWLLWGGPVWTPIVAALGLGIGYVVHKLAGLVTGSLGSLILAVAASLVWWLFFAGMVSQGITHAIASSRMQDEAERLGVAIPEQIAKVESLDAAVQPIKQKLDDLNAQIDAAVQAGAASGVSVTELIRQKTPVKLAYNAAVSKRNKADEIRKQMQRRLLGIRALPKNQAELDEITKRAAEARANLPASVAKFDSINLDLVITRLYDEVGLFGLTPVSSREFGGFMLAILLGITGIVLSFPLGILLALGRLSNLIILRSMCIGFIEFIRGVPLITLLFVASALLNYFLPKGTEFDIILRVMIMIVIFSAAYMAEVIRGGLAALPRGQYEAADALGLDYWQAQQLIIMPQALKISIPGIVSTFIGLFKDTTLVSIIALSDYLGTLRLCRPCVLLVLFLDVPLFHVSGAQASDWSLI